MAEKAHATVQTWRTLIKSEWSFDLAFAGLALLVFAYIIIALWRTDHLRQLKVALGMKGFPTWAFVLAAGLWLLIFSLLVAGIIVAIPKIALHEPLASGNKEELWNWRFLLLTLTALTATLGAVLALPITLYRLRLRRRQAEIADEALFNEKINVAAGDLHARRQVTKIDEDGKPYDAWEDDVVRRNAAIDRLEGLARERPEIAPRIARLLSTYVRELSKEYPPQQPPEKASLEELREWAERLRPCRSDMENAAQVLGRLQQIEGVEVDAVRIDLRGANLQGFDLHESWLKRARLSGAHMQGANFRRAQLQGVNLYKANMQYINLYRAYLQGAILEWANLQGANLADSQLQGVDLWGADLQKAYLWDADLKDARLGRAQMKDADLDRAQLKGTVLRYADLQGANLRRANLVDVDISEANLRGAVFENGRIIGVYLEGVDLHYANFGNASIEGAALRNTNCQNIKNIKQDQINRVFGDGSVTLPKHLKRPNFWPKESLDWLEFENRWRAWQKECGYDTGADDD